MCYATLTIIDMRQIDNSPKINTLGGVHFYKSYSFVYFLKLKNVPQFFLHGFLVGLANFFDLQHTMNEKIHEKTLLRFLNIKNIHFPIFFFVFHAKTPF